MASSTKSSIHDEIQIIDKSIRDIDSKLAALKEEKLLLLSQKDRLKDKLLLEKSKQNSLKDWSGTNFPWSEKLTRVMKSDFGIESLRPLQLESINATMSNEDTILIMPTGGGKSLCYQLPALLSNGITLVISPLVALMEDQVRNLRMLRIDALAVSANSSKEEVKNIADALKNKNSKVRLIYVTPERLAKSKRFMSQLQNCHSQGRFVRLAIDEVHCCSTWGHDFRTDYNFLGVLKDMFPKVPILGLTATSSAKVTLDVQKMLNIEGCTVLRAAFNRPNLFYTVLQKPNALSDCVEMIAGWATGRFKRQTGIVYTTTIKDCESLATELKKRGVKVGLYHAMLEADTRSKMYEKWVSGEVQLVVATIAFGLGIDKPDVRFVIHHALSKSIEMLYQESGRAGRDGKPADCIVLYQLSDVSKLATMVFTQRTGLDNLHSIVKYCLSRDRCRRSIIAEHFDEVWRNEDCNGMCDNCSSQSTSSEYDVANYCRSLYKLLEHASNQDRQLTAIKLIDGWFNMGEAKLRVKDVTAPSLSRAKAEAVVALLLTDGYLKGDFHYTAYSTICYLKKGPKSTLLENKSHRINLRLASLPKELSQRKKSSDLINNVKKVKMDTDSECFDVSDSDSDIIVVKKRKTEL